MKHIAAMIVCLFAISARGEQLTQWDSVTTGATLNIVLYEPAPSNKPLATVIYMRNLSVPRVGRDSDEAIIGDLVKSGDLVVAIDYAHDSKAISPNLNADVLKLRREIADTKQKKFLTDHKIDPDHLFFLAEGFRLKRNVEFAHDGDRVLGMDVCYPANPTKPVPMLFEITCDNVNRMGSFSLLFCHDTLLEGAELSGFATAMIDHPVRAPYKGIDDPMPESITRMEAAVKVLRSLAPELKTSDKLGAIGFSRGGPFAAVLAVTNEVDAALIHGNRYDYLDLLPNDKDIAKFTKVWGKQDENRDKWAIHGALYYLGNTASPMFLNTSDKEQVEYRDGLAKVDKRLTDLGIKHTYQVDNDGRGHQITTDPKTLAEIYGFFHQHLDK